MCETVMRTIGLVCVHRRSVRAQNSQDGDWVLSPAGGVSDDMEEEVDTDEEGDHVQAGVIVIVLFFLFNATTNMGFWNSSQHVANLDITFDYNPVVLSGPMCLYSAVIEGLQ